MLMVSLELLHLIEVLCRHLPTGETHPYHRDY